MLFGRLIRSVDGIYILFNAVTNAAPQTTSLYICHNFSMSRLICKTRQSALLPGKSMAGHDTQINYSFIQNYINILVLLELNKE